MCSTHLKISSLFLVTSLLAGCSGIINVKDELGTKEGDPALARIAASAENIQKQWGDIAAIESAKYRKEGGSDLPKVDGRHLGNLDKLVSLGDSWHGPLEPLVREIAAISHFQLREKGNKPAADIIVNVGTSYRKAIDILADAGYQAGKRAAVKVLVKDQIIEIEYAKF